MIATQAVRIFLSERKDVNRVIKYKSFLDSSLILGKRESRK